MPSIPKLTEREWRKIATVLPATGGVGRPRQDDRRAVNELLYFEVEVRSVWAGASLQSLYGRPRAAVLVVKRARWKENGTWQRLIDAGRPALMRWRKQRHRDYGDNSDTAKVMRLFERQLDVLRSSGSECGAPLPAPPRKQTSR